MKSQQHKHTPHHAISTGWLAHQQLVEHDQRLVQVENVHTLQTLLVWRREYSGILVERQKSWKRWVVPEVHKQR